MTFAMRRNALLLAVLPLADALSLANFQQLTAIFVPISCQLTYDNQIPTCQVSDFTNGCSSSCESALNAVANDVNEACSGFTVSSTTLLGIVMNGNIIQALCPTPAVQSTTTVAFSSSAIAESASPTVTSVSIPAVVTTSSTTTKAAKSKQSTTTTIPAVAETTSSQATESTENTSDATSSRTTTAQTTTGGQRSETTATTSTKKDATSTQTAAATNSKPDQGSEAQDSGSGGGSPFDISSSGNRIHGGSMLAFVVAAWGCVLLGR